MVLVVTNPPRPAGRGSKLTATAVADAARPLALPLEERETTRDERVPGTAACAVARRVDRRGLRRVAAERGVERSSARLRERALLAAAALARREPGPARDPRGRSRHRGDADADGRGLGHRTGAGAPARSRSGPTTTPARSAPAWPAIGAEMVARLLPDLATSGVTSTPQEGVATFAPKLGAVDRLIDWSRPADELVRRVRAFAPDPGATTRFRGEDLKVASSRGVRAGGGRGRERSSASIARASSSRRGPGPSSCSRSRQPGGVGCRPPIGRAACAIWPASGSDHDHGAIGRGRDGASRHRRGRVFHAGPARAPRAFAPGRRATGRSRRSWPWGRCGTSPGWIERSDSGRPGRSRG